MKASANKKNPVFAPALVAGILMACSTAHAATTIFNDTFNSGTGAWYKAYNNSNTTLANDGSGRLSFAPGAEAGGYEVIGRSFATQTIGVGQSITLSFDYRQTSATGILRFGLYDLVGVSATANNWAFTNTGTYAGYTTFIRDSGSNIARRETAAFNTDFGNNFPTHGATGTVTDITTSGGATNFSFANNTDYQFSFTIERVSATQTDTLLTVMEGATERYAVGGSQTSGTQLGVFDTAALRVDSGTALFDNVQVTFIPEPSAALLGSLGLLALLRRRR